MSQIKFACCFCSQRISGDDAYCGNLIFCPSCGRQITVPGFSAFSNESAIPLAIPQAATTADPQLWTEEAWEEHVEEVAPSFSNFKQSLSLSVIGALAILLPFLVVNGFGRAEMWMIIIPSAVVSGFLTAAAAPRASSIFIKAGSFLLGILLYSIFAEVCLFGGCIWPRD
jgi:hypothetical protein